MQEEKHMHRFSRRAHLRCWTGRLLQRWRQEKSSGVRVKWLKWKRLPTRISLFTGAQRIPRFWTSRLTGLLSGFDGGI